MLISKPAAGFNLAVIAFVLSAPCLARAEAGFRLEPDSQGLIRPFRAVALPLPKFVREYARLTGTPIAVEGSWDRELRGAVTLFIRHPLKKDDLTEIFHRVLNENGFVVVDAPAGNGWVIERAKEARDAALPVYEIGDVPDSSRMVTAYRDFKYADAEQVARMMRSFMPANSRIIPTTPSQIFITDTGSNIRKLSWIIARMDTEEAAKAPKSATAWYSRQPARSCGEIHIEKLTVDKLEMSDNGAPPTRPMPKEGAQK